MCPNGDADCEGDTEGSTVCSATHTICVGKLHTYIFYKEETLVNLNHDKLCLISFFISAPGPACPNGDADCAADAEGFTACSAVNAICVGELHTYILRRRGSGFFK